MKMDKVVDPNAALVGLAEQVHRDLDVLEFNGPDWVKPRRGPNGEAVLDTLIVGGGQSGLAAAFALQRERIRNILILDENPPGEEGPWVTYARMITLRTPKHLGSIEQGVPSLAFRTWWTTQFGEQAWRDLGKIPRAEWMRYLRWYRDVLDLPVRNSARVTRIEPMGDGLYRVHIAGSAEGETLFARNVVLATGIQGGGEWHTPSMVAQHLPRTRYAHTAEVIDFEGLKGRRLAILGGGASAFDNAQHALSIGVGEVHVFMRRSEMPRINPIRHMEVSGMIRHYASLDDARKYRAMRHFIDHAQPPTNDTFARASAYRGFHLHLGAPWLDLKETPQGAVVTTPQGEQAFDFLILSTGLVTDTRLRPELDAVRDDIALWSDRYQPPPDLAHPLIDQHPYLGSGFEYQPRSPEVADRVAGLYAFNYSALASLGLSASALSGLKVALPKLASSISTRLFVEDQDKLLADFIGYDEPEFVGTWSAN